MTYFNKWLAAALVRALKTMAQSAIAAVGTTKTMGDVDWRMVLSISLLSGFLSLLTSLGGLPEVPKDSNKDVYYPSNNDAEPETVNPENGEDDSTSNDEVEPETVNSENGEDDSTNNFYDDRFNRLD